VNAKTNTSKTKIHTRGIREGWNLQDKEMNRTIPDKTWVQSTRPKTLEEKSPALKVLIASILLRNVELCFLIFEYVGRHFKLKTKEKKPTKQMSK
jgi:hypothetical protein